MTTPVTPQLSRADAQLRVALAAATLCRDFTRATLRDATAAFGAAARRAGHSADEVLARLQQLLDGALSKTTAAAATDAVLVYLWRFARRAHEDAPRPLAV